MLTGRHVDYSTGRESIDSSNAEAHCGSTDAHLSSVSAKEEETREVDDRLATSNHY